MAHTSKPSSKVERKDHPFARHDYELLMAHGYIPARDACNCQGE
jgi:hypothetical protein